MQCFGNYSAKARLLNLGCGTTFHPEWINIDFDDHNGAVLAYDLRLGVPFANDSVDVIYHSHVLEHFTRQTGRFFLEECFRTLRPGGLMRVVVPDLENIARAYLTALEDAEKTGDQAAHERHEWMTIELVDQMTRTHSGGEMADFWMRNPVPQEDFVFSRAGQEFLSFQQRFRGEQRKRQEQNTALPVVNPDFVLGGELHRWMYDAVSLKHLLTCIGFAEITRQTFDTSLDPRILRYGLDMAGDGSCRKPDSFFMEARKPMLTSTVKVSTKVAILCTADSGGAGTACLRLHKALRNTSVQTEMYVGRQESHTPNLHVLPGTGRVVSVGMEGAAALSTLSSPDKEVARYTNRPQGLEIFTSTKHSSVLETVPFFEDFEVVNLHWISNFLDVSSSMEALKNRPVVWTLHDMRPFTGGCHYAGECRKYLEHCGACSQLGSSDPEDLSFRTWKASMIAYRQLDLHIVAPSRWLAEEAQKSSLFRRFPVHVISNAHPLGVFNIKNKVAIRRNLGIGVGELALAFAAQNLTNERKGTRYLVECLHILARSPLNDKIHLMLFGKTPPEEFFRLGIKATPFGHVDDPDVMAILYNAADAVVVPSLEDNSPNVICEAAGCGTPVVAFAVGGIPEMIQHKETGWLSPAQDAQSLAEGIQWVDKTRRDPLLATRCRAFALERWNENEGARRYVEIFTSLVQKSSGRINE